LRNSTSALSFSVVERTRLIAERIFDFHSLFRSALRFEIRALFSADLCCAIQRFLSDTDENVIRRTQIIKKGDESQSPLTHTLVLLLKRGEAPTVSNRRANPSAHHQRVFRLLLVLLFCNILSRAIP
jgi:hypothetical protein